MLRSMNKILLIAGIFLIGILLISCASISQDKRTFFGWGSYKDSEIEIKSDHPFKDLVGLKFGIN